MKLKPFARITPILALLSVTAAELQTNPTKPIQPATSGPKAAEYVLERIPESAIHHHQAGIPRIHLWDSTSGNWSGYAVPGTSGSDTFTGVLGTWQVPTVTGSRGKTTYSSVWVGLDGYDTGSVEQIGTEQDWTKSGQQNYAWFEMYPSGSYLIRGFPAYPGDSITAQVVYQGNGVFQLTIANTTHKASYTVPSSYTTSPTVTRQSAEWIVEAPWSGHILPLADFGTVHFSDCLATSVGSGGEAEPISFWSAADPLTMVDPYGGESVPTSLTLKPGGDTFSVQWK